MIAEILTAARDHFDDHVEGLRSVEIYAGQFTREQLAKKAYKSPACLVACLGFGPSREARMAGHMNVDARFGAVFLSNHARGLVAASSKCLVLGEQTARAIENYNFGVAGADVARDIRLTNAFDLQLLEKGHAMWSLLWTQTVGLSSSLNDGVELHDFLNLCVGTDEQHTLGSIDLEIDGNPTQTP